MIIRIAVAVAIVTLSLGAAYAQTNAYRITGMDGSPVFNHIVPPATGDEIRKLPAVVGIGNPKGDVTIYEFYDLNCSFCRRAATDLRAMLAADKQLNLVLVPFPVLGIPSIQAGRVEFALAKLASPQQFARFHQKIFSGRGVVDGRRALGVAQELGFASEKIIALADEDSTTEAMKAHVRLGDKLQAQATPSFVVGDIAMIGYPGRAAMEKVVASVRKCGKAVC
jgi:protein-disulfide isomerase